jgi:hypothetical protein
MFFASFFFFPFLAFPHHRPTHISRFVHHRRHGLGVCYVPCRVVVVVVVVGCHLIVAASVDRGVA